MTFPFISPSFPWREEKNNHFLHPIPPPSLRTVTGGKVRFTLPHRRGYSNHQWWRSQELGSSASKWDCEPPRRWIRMNFANVQTSNPSLQNMVHLCGTVYCSRIWIIAHDELPVVPYWWVKIWMGLNKEFVGMERPYLEGTMDSVIIFWVLDYISDRDTYKIPLNCKES